MQNQNQQSVMGTTVNEANGDVYTFQPVNEQPEAYQQMQADLAQLGAEECSVQLGEVKQCRTVQRIDGPVQDIEDRTNVCGEIYYRLQQRTVQFVESEWGECPMVQPQPQPQPQPVVQPQIQRNIEVHSKVFSPNGQLEYEDDFKETNGQYVASEYNNPQYQAQQQQMNVQPEQQQMNVQPQQGQQAGWRRPYKSRNQRRSGYGNRGSRGKLTGNMMSMLPNRFSY